ncbi:MULTISPECIES: DMT family transporter [unclassified Pseudomonas]|uniref:DMT family transporter n=1 Tax=unclassified Pseudomonas TaxID=196821 RepID=UPI0037F40AFF
MSIEVPAVLPRSSWLLLLPVPLLEAAMVIAWSSGFVGARFSIDYAPPFLVVFWRCFLLSLFILPLVWKDLRTTNFSTLCRQGGIGMLAMAGYLGGVVYGISLGVPAGLAALFADLLPIGTAVLAFALGQLSLSKKGWMGLGVGLVGVLLVTHDAFGYGEAPLWANLLPLLGMLSLAVATVWRNHSSDAPKMGMLASLWLQCAVSAVIFGVVVGFDSGLAPIYNAGFASSVIWTALVSTLGGYGLYWVCLHRTSPTRVASALYLSPAVTLIWAWAMFGEPLSALMFLGLAISAVGISMVIKGERSRSAAVD